MTCQNAQACFIADQSDVTSGGDVDTQPEAETGDRSDDRLSSFFYRRDGGLEVLKGDTYGKLGPECCELVGRSLP